ncbi:MAG: hypothetical protein KGJ08_01875 [Gammaproteobacteria bacterium]|nr:hypothetical protein [Gammaproteobacteria bacterium]
MTPYALIYTAVLLGLFVLAGGSYGGFYSVGKLWTNAAFIRTGIACYLVAILLALAICLFTPLAALWKIFIVLSCLIYAAIPPVTWRYLAKLHRTPEESK